MDKNKKIIVICGQTGVGKTAFAVRLAKRIDGEILSVDSRQVYRGMDVVTGKIDSSKLKVKSSKLKLKVKSSRNLVVGSIDYLGIKLWGVDLVEPNEKFSAAEFVEIAEEIINDIQEKGKIPILTVGTYFYLKALISGVETIGVEPDWELRRRLGYKDIKILRGILRDLDPERLAGMNESDRNNPRRIIRAIEVGQNKKLKIKNKEYEEKIKNVQNSPEIIKIGLELDNKRLYKKIDNRVEKRVKEGAFIETENLAKKYSWDLPSMSGIGYRQLKLYIEGQLGKEEAIKKWKFAEHKYARQQMTWFKKDKQIIWFDVSKSGWEEEVEKMLR